VVEEVDVGETAGLEEAEHTLGLGGEVRQPGQAGHATATGLGGAKQLGHEHGAQGEAADAAGGLPEEGPAGQVVGEFSAGIHGISYG